MDHPAIPGKGSVSLDSIDSGRPCKKLNIEIRSDFTVADTSRGDTHTDAY